SGEAGANQGVEVDVAQPDRSLGDQVGQLEQRLVHVAGVELCHDHSPPCWMKPLTNSSAFSSRTLSMSLSSSSSSWSSRTSSMSATTWSVFSASSALLTSLLLTSA